MPEFDSTLEYRPVPNFPGYLISNHGEAWSCWLRGPKPIMTNVWRKQKLGVDTKGRLKATFTPGRKQVLIHRLVLQVFVGPCPEGMEACHYPDVDPTNNHVNNLRWDTHANNMADAVRHGRMSKGEEQHSSKLTDKKVIRIRQLFDSGYTTYEIAEKYGVRQGTIWYIVARKTWKHIA